uniref:Uncharacterized protein n=1 Tax=Vitis vinifera TaxID=29760 RepID=A5B6M1_VITVI|nr:hypothetical protein VITISV_016888 [Vitis vinifera]
MVIGASDIGGAAGGTEGVVGGSIEVACDIDGAVGADGIDDSCPIGVSADSCPTGYLIEGVQMRSVRFRRCTKRAAKSLRSKMLISQRCEVVFQLAVFGFQCDGKLQGEIHNTVQKGCEIISQQKDDFASLCKILPSAWSDQLAMAVTPSFQL